MRRDLHAIRQKFLHAHGGRAEQAGCLAVFNDIDIEGVGTGGRGVLRGVQNFFETRLRELNFLLLYR